MIIAMWCLYVILIAKPLYTTLVPLSSTSHFALANMSYSVAQGPEQLMAMYDSIMILIQIDKLN